MIVLDRRITPGESFTLAPGDIVHLNAWQPRAGEAFTVIDRAGALVRARLISLTQARAEMTAFESIGAIERGPDIVLLQALPERERFELIIQKATELGVTEIIPNKTERSISLEELDARQKRSHNWQNLAVKATKQSRRWDIPRILPYASFIDAVGLVQDADLKVMLWERAGLISMKDYIEGVERPVKKAAILVGPEGGFTEKEAEFAQEAGFKPVSLGKSVLRTETAAFFGVGLLRYELGG